MTQSALYSKKYATQANLSLSDLGLSSWEPDEVKPLQTKIGAEVDGWFGPKSIKLWKAWARKNANSPVDDHAEVKHGDKTSKGCVIINGVFFQPPPGVTVINYLEPDGAPSQKNDTGNRVGQPIQMVLHRGAERKMKSEKSLAHATERVLDAKGCSTTFTMDTDGSIYQHFDPGLRHGIHCVHHNSQSDSLDIAGPFSWNVTPAPGQEKLTLQMAIGRKDDGVPPLKRKYGTVKCWSMTPEQREALKLFLPWYCELRGIELTACEDWRTFRVGGLGAGDPVTNVKGIIAHCQIAKPGSRVDGILPLHHLKEDGCTEIRWREAENFLD